MFVLDFGRLVTDTENYVVTVDTEHGIYIETAADVALSNYTGEETQWHVTRHFYLRSGMLDV